MPGEQMIITISHQLGCGGAALGQKLSDLLGIPFFDREILIKVSEELHLAEPVVQGRDERLSSFWQFLNRMGAALSGPVERLSMQSFDPDDRAFFQVESECIRRIAEHSSGIFLGRCGRYILSDHSHLFNILVYANFDYRIQRVQELFGLGASAAKKLIARNDRDRDAYMSTFARKNWLDVRWYDLCVNTSSLGIEQAAAASILRVRTKIAVC